MREKLEVCFEDLNDEARLKVKDFLGMSEMPENYVITEIEKNKNFIDVGIIVSSKKVSSFMKLNNSFAEFCTKCLARHIRCDWGELDPYDIEANESALIPGLEGRVVSKYRIPGDVLENQSILIITEADRQKTTILFQDEY